MTKGQTVCPRCGARDSFGKGYLPETCVCRICQSQLDWREIPGCGPDCQAAAPPTPAPEPPADGETLRGGSLGGSLGGEPGDKGSVDV